MISLGLRANAPQFILLVALNAVVGAIVGLERSVLPLVGEREFGVESASLVLAFVLAFGVAKALANLAAGVAAVRVGRRRTLLAGWILALPVAPLVALAPSWGFIVAANVFLGASQGLAWSMTVLMKIDLVGPARRGLALGLNEAAGYIGLALTAFATGALAGTVAPRTLVWTGAAVLAAAGALATLLFVRDTTSHVELEHAGARSPLPRDGSLLACSQAGLVNNLNDAVAWGLVPLYLAAQGASASEIGVVAALYPAVWGAGQIGAGWLSDEVGRTPLIAGGMLVQAAGLAVLAAFREPIAFAVLLGAGTALAYPTLIAAVSDAVEPRRRAHAVGVYRFWRDTGFVVGAAGAGVVADVASMRTAIAVVAALTAASGLSVALGVRRGARARRRSSRPRAGARARSAAASARAGRR